MKIRKKISEVKILSGNTATSLLAVLGQANPNKVMDEVEIVLSDAEVYAIYEAQLKLFQVQDAKEHLDAFVFGTDPDALDEASVKEEKGKFQKRYGFSYDEAIDPNSPHFVLEEASRRFRGKYNCEIDENTQWEFVIENLLKNMAI